MLFPEPRKVDLNGEQLALSELRVSGVCTDLFLEATRVFGFEALITKESNIQLQIKPELQGLESYEIQIDDNIVLNGCSEEALARGIWTLVELLQKTNEHIEIPKGYIWDSAYMPIRAVHVYLPPADAIAELKRFLSILAMLKYNAVILEIGAGMKYDKHPEINLAWAKFCREAYRYPGGPRGLQASEVYWKDATHVELAGGSSLNKSEVRDIVDYCRLLRMNVIPEIQSLSHSYYLVLADKTIAERSYEKWPDTYCPSNERSYQLYEDCAEEIIELIHPEWVSIGHDEARILGECPKCRKKSGEELFANDVNRIYQFYHKRGIKVMMWAEKLQNTERFKGIKTGGVGFPEITDKYGRKYSTPATLKAIDMIPKDILLLDWLYSMGESTELEFKDKGFSQLFGNFNGATIANWQERSKRGNVLGAEVSLWCTPVEQEIGENGRFYELAFSSAVLWRTDFCDTVRTEWNKMVEKILPEIRSLINEKLLKFDGTAENIKELFFPEKKYNRSISVDIDSLTTVSFPLAQGIAANKLNEGKEFVIEETGSSIVFFHAADTKPEKRTPTWFFTDPEPRITASYAIDYEDGVTLRIPVLFPDMTGSLYSDSSFCRPRGAAAVSVEINDDQSTQDSNPAPVFAMCDVWRSAAIYFNRTIPLKEDEKTITVYAWEWKNIRTDSKIMKIRLINEEKSPINLHCYGVAIL